MGDAFKFDRVGLRQALAIVSSATEKKNTIPVLSFLLLESKDGRAVLTGTDIDVTVSLFLDSECEGAFCAPATQLREAAKLATEDITIRRNDKRAIFQSGDFSAHLPALEASDFPQCPTVPGLGVKVPGELFARMLKVAVIASDRQENNAKWALNSVCAQIKDSALMLVSSDEHQLAVASIPVKAKDAEFLIPRRSLSALIAFAMSEPEVELAGTENHFGLIGASGSVVSRLVVGRFPNWRMAVPKSYAHTITANAEDLALTLKQAAVGLDFNIGTRWEVTKKQLVISSKSPERESSGSMSIDCPTLNGDVIALGLNAPAVLTFLNTVSGEVRFSFNDPNQSFEFLPQVDGFDYQYITMAMRPEKY